MTDRERVFRILNHKEADRVPKYDAFWEDTIEEFYSQGLPKDLMEKANKIVVQGEDKVIGDPICDYFGYDIDCLYLDSSMRMEAKLIEKNDKFTIMQDRCGYTVKKFTGKSCSMDFIDHVNKTQEDWEKLKHRFVLDPEDTSRIDSEHFFLRLKPYPSWEDTKRVFDEYRKRERFITVTGYGPLEGTWRHHGFTETLMDLLVEKEYMHDMFEKITDLEIKTLQHAIDMGIKPDAFWINEDMGNTRSTMFSPETYKEMLWPYHRRIGDFLHANGIYYFMHSCGKIDTFLPYIIDAGIDAIQPLQASTGMDVRELKKEYGKDITFFGNIAEGSLSGSFEDIEREIAEKVTAAMKDGGYIYHSDHSIPPSVSLENYKYAMKMLEKYGTYK